jgi:hypothetical protein
MYPPCGRDGQALPPLRLAPPRVRYMPLHGAPVLSTAPAVIAPLPISSAHLRAKGVVWLEESAKAGPSELGREEDLDGEG